MTRIQIDIQTPSHLPTKEEKFEQLKEMVSDLIDMAETGHNEKYALKCLRVVLKKLKDMPKPTKCSQQLSNTIERFLVQQGAL